MCPFVLCQGFSTLSPFVCLQKVSTLLLAFANCCPLTLPGMGRLPPLCTTHLLTQCTRVPFNFELYFGTFLSNTNLINTALVQQIFSYTLKFLVENTYLAYLGTFMSSLTWGGLSVSHAPSRPLYPLLQKMFAFL